MNKALKAVQMIYANSTPLDWPEDIWDAICKAIAEAEKQDKFHENWQEIDCPACGTLAKAKFQFYTHPQPKREWVELTRKEYEDIYANNKTVYDAMMVVATYLKRKNK